MNPAVALDQAKPPTPAELEWLRREAARELAYRHVVDFAQYVDPNYASKYGARHMRVIGEALDRVADGRCRRLYIHAPPRHLKSSLVCEKFTLKYLADHPDHTVGVFSHGAALPLRFSKNVRGNVDSNPRFRELYGRVRLKPGSSNQSDWSLEGAYRSSFRSFGVGSAPTGEGFDLIVVDDPVPDAEAAYNPDRLEAIWQWYRETLRDRLNPGGKIVLVMSRWHECDLAGMVLKESRAGTGEQWESVVLPAVSNEAGAACEFEDATARALWPAQWPLDALLETKLGQGSRAFAARYQGSPRAASGNALDSTRLVMVEREQVPKLVEVVRYWDLAFSDKAAADFVAGVKMGLSETNQRVILDVEVIKGKWTQSEPVIRRVAHRDEPECRQAIECNGTQLGYYQQLSEDPSMADRTVVKGEPEGSKEMRAALWGARLEDGVVLCVRAPWNGELFDEMDYFPNLGRDHVVDGVSGCWALLGRPTGALTERDLANSAAGGSVRSWTGGRTWPGRGR